MISIIQKWLTQSVLLMGRHSWGTRFSSSLSSLPSEIHQTSATVHSGQTDWTVKITTNYFLILKSLGWSVVVAERFLPEFSLQLGFSRKIKLRVSASVVEKTQHYFFLEVPHGGGRVRIPDNYYFYFLFWGDERDAAKMRWAGLGRAAWPKPTGFTKTHPAPLT